MRRIWPLATLVAFSLAVAGCGGIRGAGSAERPEPAPIQTTVGSGGEIAGSMDDAPSISAIGGAAETEAAQPVTTTTTAAPDTTTDTTNTAPPLTTTGEGTIFDPGELDLDTSDIDQLLAELDGLLGELDAGLADIE